MLMRGYLSDESYSIPAFASSFTSKWIAEIHYHVKTFYYEFIDIYHSSIAST
jgi:hypothetical protein